jgi:glycosyltransferase involved in cell wall biosynthesis
LTTPPLAVEPIIINRYRIAPTVSAKEITLEQKKLVVIVPAYNEAASIDATVRGLQTCALGLRDLGIELAIFVVDDGSQDSTGAIATTAGADRVIRHAKNRGLGAAVRSGLRAAKSADSDIAVKFDADLQHDPLDIVALIQPILRDEVDIVYGDRFQQISYRMPLVRRIGNKVFTWLMRTLTRWDVTDSQPGIFAVSKEYLGVFRLPGDYNYTQQILLDAYHKGMRFAQVPVQFKVRTTGRSFVSLRYPVKVLPQLVMVLIGVAPLKIFGTIGLFFLLIAGVVSVSQVADYVLYETSKPIENVNLVLGLLFFGLQSLFFGLLAALINERNG